MRLAGFGAGIYIYICMHTQYIENVAVSQIRHLLYSTLFSALLVQDILLMTNTPCN